MADQHTALNDIVEESTSGTVTRNPDATAAAHHHHQPYILTHLANARRRANSSVSRVDLDFFDPAGVHELQRTLTRQHEQGEADAHGSEGTLMADKHEPFDFEAKLRDMVRKREEHNIKSRSLGIGFSDLRVTGVMTGSAYYDTLGSLLDPRVILKNIQNIRRPNLRNILDGFEGVVKPGEMLLVLGSPGSGCSTLLKTLANHRQEYHAVHGQVHYDSISPDDLSKQFRGDVLYCPEDDVHFPTLSVKQTLSFAAAARTPRVRAEVSRQKFSDEATDILATIFGLRHALGTPVGDSAIRGVSGGEKKRVSIAEGLASRACIGAWDNSTRGLDSSTALEFVRALRIATDTFEQTTIVSIYQAGESLYHHFDKVCVIYEGCMAYYGLASEAKQYFIDMGYEPANRQTTADFLVAVTDPNARIAREGVTNQPRTAAEFAEYFLKSNHGHKNRAELEAYLDDYVDKADKKNAYIQSAHAEFSKGSRKTSPYLLSIPQQVKIVMRRRFQIIVGNKLNTLLVLLLAMELDPHTDYRNALTSSYVFQSLIVGSVFLKSKEVTGAYFSRGGVLFFALLFSALSTLAEIPALYSQRPIVSRQQKAALYHPFVEALALTLVDIPITFVTMIVFAIILYFMVGLQNTAEQFFVFFLFLFTMSLTMKAWFRAIAAAFPSEAAAQSFAGVSLLALSIYTGYTIPKPSMIGALRWITYINPLKYGFESIMTNEFRTLSGKCSNLVPQGPGYNELPLANKVCATVGAVTGEDFVDGARFVELSYGFKYSNTWMNFGINIAFGVAFIVALLFFTEYNSSTSAHDNPVTLFKRGAKTSVVKVSPDEEAGAASENVTEPTSITSAKVTAPRMTDIFLWRDITYTVPISGKDDRRLLDNVSGYVAPGKLTALMGESGAGKTTLLNVLAARTDTGVVTGDRLVNGKPLPADFQSQSGYCQQTDTHVPYATVRETLLFSAKLRQPASVPLVEKEAYVEKCLEMCGLTAYAEASVGTLSIEHKKRTTIGVELAAKPKLLLFLDEPTSGLDSQSAWAIMSFLRSLADNGQAILCTIHQPSAELFQVFDRILLLRKGGQTVYFGDIGTNSTKLISYFETNGARECLPHENPAEYMLDVIGAGATATSAQDWHEVWTKAPQAKQVQDELDEIVHGKAGGAISTEIHSEFATSWVYQLMELLVRNAQAHWRNPTYLMSKMVLNGVGGLFIGFTFFHAKDSQQGTQNKIFAIFMATILSVPLSNQLQVPFINMRSIYEIRERPSRMYSWTALVTSQILVELPWNIIGSFILFVTLYWTVGFDNSRAGYTFLMLVIVYPVYYTTFGLAVAAMSPNAEIAAVLFSLLFSFVLIFNGVLQPYRELEWWKWMYRLSPYTYLVEGLLGQALGHQEVNCDAIEFVTISPPDGLTCAQYMDPYMSVAGGYLTNPNATSACSFCSVRTTDQFLGLGFNIFYDNHWRNFGIMAAFILFNVVFVYILTFLFRIHKGSFLPSFRKKN